MTSVQTRATQLAPRLQQFVQSTAQRIQSSQQALMEKKRREDEAEKRAVNRRIRLARQGLARLVAFARKRSIQQIAEVNAQLPGRDDGITLSFFQWARHSDGVPMCDLRCIIRRGSVSFHTVDLCWVSRYNSFQFSLKGDEVRWKAWLEGREPRTGPEAQTVDEVLHAIARRERVNLRWLRDARSSQDYNAEEEAVVFEVLVSWARADIFEQAATACLNTLEKQLKNRLY